MGITQALICRKPTLLRKGLWLSTIVCTPLRLAATSIGSTSATVIVLCRRSTVRPCPPAMAYPSLDFSSAGLLLQRVESPMFFRSSRCAFNNADSLPLKPNA